jgi:hypothetical protein
VPGRYELIGGQSERLLIKQRLELRVGGTKRLKQLKSSIIFLLGTSGLESMELIWEP